MNSRLLNTFLDLVKIDSPLNSEKEISDYLKRFLEEKNIEVVQDTYNNIFVKIPGDGEPLFLAAHMDTVEPGKGVKPIIEGDIIKSDGSTILGADNKSTLAVLLELIIKITEEDISHRPLEILFTVDEENSSLGARKFNYSQLLAKKGLIADIAEPLGTVVIASPAYVSFDITFIGESGHAAYPEKATNVLDVVADVLKIKKGRLDTDTTLNIGLVLSGTARNTIPGEAELHGEIRSYKQDLVEKYTDETIHFIEQAAKNHNIEVKIDHKQDNAGYIFSEEDLYVKEIGGLLQSFGFAPRFIKGASVSDGNEFNAHNLQVVNIGDGTVKTHTLEEHIKISDMEKLLEIFLKFISF